MCRDTEIEMPVRCEMHPPTVSRQNILQEIYTDNQIESIAGRATYLEWDVNLACVYSPY